MTSEREAERECLKCKIEADAEKIKEMEKTVADAKEATAQAVHDLNVQIRYGSRVRSAIQSADRAAMDKLIDDDEKLNGPQDVNGSGPSG